MKGIYLAAYKAKHEGAELIYQDINGERDLAGDMMEIDLTPYDYIIATPPCNWWSRANYRRNTSEYALKTKHLLIDILNKLSQEKRPFIVENVRNDSLFKQHGLFNFSNLYFYKIGRHTYWSNIKFKCDDIIQIPKTIIEDGKKKFMSSQNLARKDRQGGEEVHQVIERFLETIGAKKMIDNKLRLEIQPDGKNAALFEGRDLAIGFKWKEERRAYELIGSSRRWENLILYNHALHYYLNRVLELLDSYREEASKLAAQRKAIEDSLSGFLSIESE